MKKEKSNGKELKEYGKVKTQIPRLFMDCNVLQHSCYILYLTCDIIKSNYPPEKNYRKKKHPMDMNTAISHISVWSVICRFMYTCWHKTSAACLAIFLSWLFFFLLFLVRQFSVQSFSHTLLHLSTRAIRFQ